MFNKNYSNAESYTATTANSVDNGDGTYTYTADIQVNTSYSRLFINVNNVLELNCLPIAQSSTSMESMFYECSGLTQVNLTNLGSVETVGTMANMFYNCSNLTEIDLSSLSGKTSTITSTKMLFMSCSKLETVNLSGWDLSHLTNYSNHYGYMFNGCNSLKKIILGNISQTAYDWWKSKVIDDYAWTDVTIEYTIV